MHCPIDQTELVMTDRQGVEIDYCPTCRGVWLDRGELDKIIDRSASPAPSRPEPRPTQVTSSRDAQELTSNRSNEPYPDDDDDKYDKYGKKKKKRGSFLEDLFDF